MKSWLQKILLLLNILLYFTCILLWISAPDNLVLNLSTSIFTLTFTIVLLITQGAKLRAMLLSRFSKRFYSEMIGLFLVACIISVLNYLVFKNYKQWDISNDQMNTLSEQTKQILKNLKAPVKLTLFAKRENWEQVLPILRLYHEQKRDIILDAVDVEMEPQKVRAQGLTQFPALVLESGKNKNTVLVMDELSLTNGFLKLSETKVTKVYAITGHGELDINDMTNEGASVLVTMMRGSNIEVEPLALVRAPAIPKDASALMMLGPQEGLLDGEIKMLREYLKNGGRLIMTAGPDFKGNRSTKLHQMLAEFGIKINNDIVIDRLSSVHNVDATIPIVEKYQSTHPIMKSFKGTTIFPLSSSLELVPSEDYRVEPLVETSAFPASWGEKDLAQANAGKVTFDAKVDLKGPIALAAVAYEPASNDLEMRLSVFASTSLVVNGYANQSPNFNLFLNALSWLVGNEGLISLNRPVLNQERIMMGAPQIGTIFYFSVVFLPLVLFILAFYLYRRRLKL